MPAFFLTRIRRRLREIKEDVRPAFFHDADKILHSTSFTRYIDKTQVFSFEDNDHVSKRMVHVQLVSKIARCIGRCLNLNEDLIEAAALGRKIKIQSLLNNEKLKRLTHRMIYYPVCQPFYVQNDKCQFLCYGSQGLCSRC